MSLLTFTPYIQNFDILALTGLSSLLPEGWYFAESGTNADATYSAGTGSSNAGNTYSFGAAGSSDRALGGLQSGSLIPTIGAMFQNDSGTTITELQIAYTGEQWRLGFSPRPDADRLTFQYSLDANSLTTGTWLDFDPLDFIAPVTAGAVGALDGNDPANRVQISATLDGLSLSHGETFWIRWNSFDVANADDGLAIDDFSITIPFAGEGRMEITEYLYDGANAEFIEFTNVGTAPVDMSGWSYDDDSRLPGTVDLSAFGIVQPGESVILAEASAAAFRAAWGVAPSVKVIGDLTINLGRNDEINLYDDTGTLVDRLTYGDQNFPGTIRTQNTSGWAPPDELTDQDIDGDWRFSTLNDAQNSWRSSGNDLGNPGVYNTGAAGVLVREPGGNTAVAEGGGSDSYVLVLRSAPTADVVITIDAGSQLALDTQVLTFTPDDWHLPRTVTVNAVDDAVAEGPHTATLIHTVTSADAAYDGLAIQNVDVAIADNDTNLPSVTLSVSATVAIEAEATAITVTATVSEVLESTQSVELNVGGDGITLGDYYLSSTVITIAAGESSGSVTFIVSDDATAEGTETALLSLANPSAGLVLSGSDNTREISILNNDASFLTKLGGAQSVNGAEIPAFDPLSSRVFVVAGPTIEYYTLDASGGLSLAGTLDPGFTPPPGTTVLPNSVAVHDGVLAVAYAVVSTATNAQQPGHVSFYDTTTLAVLNDVEVGYLPDMVIFTPDGSRVLTANEGEPNSYGLPDSFDPVGSISIIDLSAGIAAATVQEAGFESFNDQYDSLVAQGVRLFGPGASVAQDLEPEYIAISPDGSTAYVTLQEANALALVDIASATVTDIVPLGLKDFSLPGNGFDASDRDGGINIQNWPVFGMYMPDAIAGFSVGGQAYYITANEGDSRDYPGFNEEIRVGASGYVLDPDIFPDAAVLKQDANLGRMQLTGASGDLDGDGDYDQIMAFGARSFSIWDSAGSQVYDSGDALEQITAARTPTLFNSDGLADSFDTRSDNKGPEPEGVTVGEIGGRPYAFVGLERSGDIMVFDLSTPTAPKFVQYINTPEDVAAEGLVFVGAGDSPTGKPLLIVTYEVSQTVSVFQIQVPVRIADIQGSAHISPLLGQGVTGVEGKVTAITTNGFWIQDPLPDNDPRTSEGVFVFTTDQTILGARHIGEAVKVSGTVAEFRPGGDANNLTITEILNGGPQALVVAAWTDAPDIAITPIVLGVDRIAPTEVINDDFVGTGNVETGGDFDPAVEGIDFYESLEGMLVQVDNPLVISPTNNFGEIWVLPNGGAGATGLTARGGSLISADDFNPERLQLDNLLPDQLFPAVNVGAHLNTVVGVMDYSFNNFELRLLETPTVALESPLEREVTSLVGSADALTVSTFNVENLDPGDGPAMFAALANAIVNNLLAPDILNLEEVQDNSGPLNNGVVAADETLQLLIDAIVAAGGPTYEFRQIDPVNNQDGGEPGGNIRNAFLFNPARVSFVEDSLQRLIDTDLSDGNAFANSRKPLVGTFVFNGEEVTVIGNHFNSKGGDGPLFGPTQPPVLSSEVQRKAQAEIVGAFVDELLAANPQAYVIVAGDLNDFEFSAPLGILKDAGLAVLIETLPENERYTYNYQGNAQTLDHLLASPGLLQLLDGVDVVHMNSEFHDQISDHDPVLARFTIARSQELVGNAGRDVLVGGAGNDILIGLGGRDLLTGGAGADIFVYTSLLDAGDQITDFEVGVDLLDISELLASVGYAGDDAVADGYLGVTQGPGRSLVTFDADGSAGPGAARVLVELLGVSDITADVLLA